ncbi:uncharacterized protein EI90DRAFT_380394 [Cantharellus anzutake]|uniref:uncharacterized protein n=1 Tax=Cantharellus anzutake TaxID=1750568 RepID=UPI001905A462|nr:uncharacterized protein EI90DRAFT_380394 [Cantharellus anzutake]KAF8334949.1 hypothetical protein EI90DRAFT_380394 [Cantharellus anzutake]
MMLLIDSRISTLILLHTEHASVQSEISRLKRAPAEHIYVETKSECLPGTRLKIQESLLEHLKKPENRFVWLRGSPGTGKTAISMSIASTLEQHGVLVASYFWDKNRKGSGLDSIKRFPSTLSCQLASFNEDFKLSLVRRLRKPDLALFQDLPLEKQIKALVIEPIRNLKNIFPSGTDRFVIVLDGLDECGNQETLESLMGLVLDLQELPQAFAVLVSCRPEPGVLSAWLEAQNEGLVIPCEDVDKIEYDENFRTVHRIVKEGLRDVMRKSSWKPTEWELNAFSRCCRGLPVMASIRIRDVCRQARRGRTLQSAFQGLLSVTDTPIDLNQEYLRILRQAYVVDSVGIPSGVSEMYRLVVTAILTASGLRNVSSMSQMLGISEDDIHATLEPISSIINLPSENAKDITFYHATASEFITGKPIGDEKDEVFFIDDVNGYLLGLPLLRYFNDCCERNEFGIPTDLPSLGEEGKWKEFMAKKKEYRRRFRYVIECLFKHLDPSKVLSQDSNKLQKEFDSFITRGHVLTFMHLQNSYGDRTWVGFIFPPLLEFNDPDPNLSPKRMDGFIRSVPWWAGLLPLGFFFWVFPHMDPCNPALSAIHYFASPKFKSPASSCHVSSFTCEIFTSGNLECRVRSMELLSIGSPFRPTLHLQTMWPSLSCPGFLYSWKAWRHDPIK